MKLKTTIFLRISALIAVLTASVAVGLSYFAVNDQRVAERNQAQALSNFLARQSQMLLKRGDVAGLRAILGEIVRGHSAADYAYVTRDGWPFIHTFDGSVPDLLLELKVAPTGPSVQDLQDQRGWIHHAATPLAESDVVIHVGVRQGDITRETVVRIQGIASFAGVALLLGVFLAWGLATLTTREVQQAQAALRDSERRYRLLFEQAPDSIMLMDVTNPQGPVIYDANEATFRMHGYTRDEVIGMPIAQLDAPDDRGKVPIRARDLELKRVITFDAMHMRKDGSTFPVEVIAQMIEIDGRPVVQAIDRDISYRKKAEDEKKRLEAQLQQAQKMEAIGQLAGGIAHDMNNILGAILASASLLEHKTEAATELHEIVQNVLVACRRGQDLTRNFLGFARKGKYTREQMSLNGIVAETRELLSRTTSKKLDFETELAPDLPAFEGDRSQINQAVMNICINAVDAMRGGGTLSFFTDVVEVEAADPTDPDALAGGRYVRLRVRDTGVGMSARLLEHVLEPFFTTKPVGEGTGLGLSMAYGAAKSHGGTLKLASEEGKGTEVTLLLPALDLAAPERAAAPLRRTPRSASSSLILLVDDEQLIRWAGQKLLQELGYEVLVAENGRVAVELFRQRRDDIALVILDLIMPVLDGPEAFEQLKRLDPEVKVILATGFSKDDKVEELLEGGAVGYLQKPFDMQQLAEMIDAAIAS